MICDEKLNELCKQQQDLIRELSKDKDEGKEQELLKLNSIIKEYRDELLNLYNKDMEKQKEEVILLMANKPKDFKKELKKHYKVLIEQYRRSMAIATDLSHLKRDIRRFI